MQLLRVNRLELIVNRRDSMKNIDTDEYGDVITTPSAAFTISTELIHKKAVFIGWTDMQGTHLDILFAYNVSDFGANFQRGIGPDDLFVCIMGGKSFGFEMIESDLHEGYVSEKLGVGGETAIWLAKLITLIRKQILANKKHSDHRM